jgi:membrane protease YdiL (CAAX protease family)
MKPPHPTAAAVEVGAMAALILSYIWLWEDSFDDSFYLCLALYLGIGLAGHLRRGETARDIGLRVDNLGPALLQALVFVGPLILISPIVGLALDTIRLLPGASWWWIPGAAERFASGTLQQYGLLCFFYRRMQELIPGTWPPLLSAAGVFALFHLPNPFLTVVTLGAGILSCWLYRRVPNLWALGLSHALLSMSISRSLPLGLTVHMRVGPGYLESVREASGAILGP